MTQRFDGYTTFTPPESIANELLPVLHFQSQQLGRLIELQMQTNELLEQLIRQSGTPRP